MTAMRSCLVCGIMFSGLGSRCVNHPTSSDAPPWRCPRCGMLLDRRAFHPPCPECPVQLRPHLESIAAILIEKNKAYGNSALDPVRVFSDARPDEAIRVRLDDKISRLVRGHAAGEDTLFDLIGYLFLLRIYETRPLSGGFAESVATVVDEACAMRLTIPRGRAPLSSRVVDTCKVRKTNPVAAIVELTHLLIELRGG